MRSSLSSSGTSRVRDPVSLRRHMTKPCGVAIMAGDVQGTAARALSHGPGPRRRIATGPGRNLLRCHEPPDGLEPVWPGTQAQRRTRNDRRAGIRGRGPVKSRRQGHGASREGRGVAAGDVAACGVVQRDALPRSGTRLAERLSASGCRLKPGQGWLNGQAQSRGQASMVLPAPGSQSRSCRRKRPEYLS